MNSIGIYHVDSTVLEVAVQVSALLYIHTANQNQRQVYWPQGDEANFFFFNFIYIPFNPLNDLFFSLKKMPLSVDKIL